MLEVSGLHPNLRKLLNWAAIVGSALLCLLLMPLRLPGTELAGARPDWVLIWVVAWSMKRTPFQGAIAGVALGLILDGTTAVYPSHAVSLGIVGFLTARLQKERYPRADLLALALIVFGMVPLAEAITALQFLLYHFNSDGSLPLSEIWKTRQVMTPVSALLSSLWAPVVYYPLNRWWQHLHRLENS